MKLENIKFIKSRILELEQQVNTNRIYRLKTQMEFQRLFAIINNNMKRNFMKPGLKFHLNLKNEWVNRREQFLKMNRECEENIQLRLAKLNNRLRELESE